MDDKARTDNKSPVFVKKVVIEKVGDTLGLRKKLYAYMKTLKDYPEATDV